MFVFTIKFCFHDYQFSLAGDVLLEKISYAKTVVNKTNTIDNTYRNFSMEVLAGERNFLTTTKENGITYEFDFSEVYWNPRLGETDAITLGRAGFNSTRNCIFLQNRRLNKID